MEVPCWIVHEISQIISEATANAVRHGGATHVCVTLTRSRGELEFCISDNGSGMQKAGSPRRPQSLTARVDDLGGRLTIRRFAPGLDLRIDLPLEPELRRFLPCCCRMSIPSRSDKRRGGKKGVSQCKPR